MTKEIIFKPYNTIIIDGKQLSHRKAYIVNHLIDLARKNKSTIYTDTNRNLAIDTNSSISTAKRALKELVDEGLIIPPQHGKRRGTFKKNGLKVKNGYDISPLYNAKIKKKVKNNVDDKS